MITHRSLLLEVSLILAVVALPLGAQRNYPPISARQFTSGSVYIKVTGAFTIDDTVAINKDASIGDGEMTWLQCGASGSAAPNATITFTTTNEGGIIVARGKLQGVGGIGGDDKPWCTGKAGPNDGCFPELREGAST